MLLYASAIRALPATLLLLLLPNSALSSPLPADQDLTPRAGGPAAVPIPPQCTVANPLSTMPGAPDTPYRPSPDFMTANQIYSYYLPDGRSADEAWQMCIEQCNGFGTQGTCKSAYMAEQYPAPPLYGGPGGYPTTSCIMFGVPVSAADLVEGEAGSYNHARTGVIECP